MTTFTRRAAEARARILAAARRLFAEQGFHATGVDRIAEQAGASKKSLYHHFRSKDELVLAVLNDYDGAYRNDFMRSVEAAARTPRARLLAIFDVARDWFEEERFSGCLFVKATGEFGRRNASLGRTCVEFKRRMRDYIEDLARQAKLERPERVAEELALLLEGAIATAHVSGESTAARTAKRMARAVVARHDPAHARASA